MTSTPHSIVGRHVLVVEDDYFIAMAMQAKLEECGVQVLGPVASVEDALVLIAAAPEIDAAVLDVNLQEEMAFPVADALQERGVPFLFATGYEKMVIPQRFASVRHCEKPVEPIRLVQLLLG